VTKSRIALVFIVALILAGMLATAIPGAASGFVIPDGWQWRDSTYQGYDDFYDDYVVAYTEGDTARLSVYFYNADWYYYGDANILSATLKMDWGLEVPTSTALPTVLPPYQGTIFEFSFTVPQTSAVTNLWEHNYIISVEFQTAGVEHAVYYQPWDYCGTGDGSNADFDMDEEPILVDSVKVFGVDYTNDVVTEFGDVYTLAADGSINFDAGEEPEAGVQVYAQYIYAGDYLGGGDGVQTQFWLDDSPIVPDSETVFIWNDVTEEYTATTAYSIDYETGMITFNTAPLPIEYIYAAYDWAESSSWYTDFGDDNFVIYSADQAATWELGSDYEAKAYYYWNYSYPSQVEARVLFTEAEQLADQAYDEYYRGEFTTARATMQAAMDKLNASVDAEVAYDQWYEDLNMAWENADLQEQQADTTYAQAQAAYMTAEAANIPKEGAYLDAQTANLNAITDIMKAGQDASIDKIKADAGREKSYGTFVILIGVFLILVGVGFLILAIGKFLAWRKPPPTT
jgi:hypothetical protein